jgi:hypothetical protein
MVIDGMVLFINSGYRVLRSMANMRAASATVSKSLVGSSCSGESPRVGKATTLQLRTIFTSEYPGECAGGEYFQSGEGDEEVGRKQLTPNGGA